MKHAEVFPPAPRRRARPIRLEHRAVHGINCRCPRCAPPIAPVDAGYGRAIRMLAMFMVGFATVTTLLASFHLAPSPLVIFGALP